MKTVTLQPVAMRVPTSECIYSPSRHTPPLKISYDEFLTKYANHPHALLFCPDDNVCLERAWRVTAYGFYGSWYIVTQNGATQ